MSLNTIFFEGLQITSQAEYFLFVEHIEIRLCAGGVQREERSPFWYVSWLFTSLLSSRTHARQHLVI